MKYFKFLTPAPDPRVYDTDGFLFVGLTPEVYDDDYECMIKYMVFLFVQDGTLITGNLIRPDHEMFIYARTLEL